MEEENKKHYDLYVVAESAYRKVHSEISVDELFPEGWYKDDNYYLKNKIIAEALINNILITDTSLYQEMINDVKTK